VFIDPPGVSEVNREARVAVVHYWLLGHRGGEKVLESICRIYPDADIFTLFYEPDLVSPYLRSRNVISSFLNPMRRFYRKLLPLMPFALESFDLRKYDLVISSESGPAKGVLTSAHTRHVCYCHTPMRYLWELYPAYRHEFGSRFERMALLPFATALRTWDFCSAARVDKFLANSRNVGRRIWKTYRRRSQVVYPPVDVDRFYNRPSGNYFLIVSEMVAYKRLDYAIRLFGRTGRRLKIVGDGPDYGRLKKLSSGCVEFCGRVSDADLAALYSTCSALIVPGEEDFGITMVEALASGKPVLALARGGAAEIVKSDCGILYPEPAECFLEAALRRFEDLQEMRSPTDLQLHAREFSEAAFRHRFQTALSSGASAKHSEVRENESERDLSIAVHMG
jgi:glycosyltransferase involved in cell wall biosynthesis